jgi:cytochrome d ubiquinol oxidase subunit I
MLSAVWIIIANSWMQTPAGFKVEGGRAVLTDFAAAALNPSFIPRYLHVIDAVLLTGGCMAAAIGAYHLLKGGNKEFGRNAIKIGLLIAGWSAIFMLFTGHWQAAQVAELQPTKMLAMEGHYQSGPLPEYLLGNVDTKAQTVSGVPFYGCFCHPLPGEFKGLTTFQKRDWPNVWITFQTYHLMLVGYILMMIVVIGLWIVNRSKKLEDNKVLLTILMWFWLVPELAIQCGWATAEVGRQPWIVQGLLRTKDAVSAVVPAYQIALTIVLFGIIYTLLFVGWARIIYKLVKEGPDVAAAKAAMAAEAAE